MELSFVNGEERENIVYWRGDCRKRSEHIEELTLIEERGQGTIKNHTFLFMQEQGMTLAAEYDSEGGFLPVSERTPRTGAGILSGFLQGGGSDEAADSQGGRKHA